MSDALKIRPSAGRSAGFIPGSRSVPRGGKNTIDPQAAVDAADARRSAPDDKRYGGPVHVQQAAERCEMEAQEAFLKRYQG